MGFFTRDTATLNDLFVDVLKTTYYAERQITETLPKLIDKASSPDLKQGFQQHLRETEHQIERLERVFQMIQLQPDESTCPAIDGIIKAGNSLVGDAADAQVRDAALAHAGQMVEHYEIVQYGSMIAWAKELGRQDCASLLAETLDEEKATDAKLTKLAEGNLNRQVERERA